ncbi:MAG: ATP-binding protein, partial [Phycisphaeraceae bacterium]|nr:ATP-binding protein [Phycisphaeraceae bacterium]
MLWATNATKYHQGFRERPLQAMESYLRGRVRNLNLSPKRCNLPVFEAVMNSLQAIEDRTSSGWKPSDARIRIAVVRDESQGTLFDGGSVPTIKDVVIEDNGVGFDDEHFAAFCRLDDDFRAAKGGKGIGRLSWLSAFQRVSVSSV